LNIRVMPDGSGGADCGASVAAAVAALEASASNVKQRNMVASRPGQGGEMEGANSSILQPRAIVNHRCIAV
jgi:hypothetical protein